MPSLAFLPRFVLLLLWGCGVLGSAALARGAEIPATALAAAGEYSATHGGAALLVRQHGKTLYVNGAPEKPHRIYSGTKGFWILAALAAQEEGVLKLDERVSETLPEWREDPRKAAVTLRDLLTFTSGLEPRFELHGNDAPPDRNRAAIGAGLVAERGESFIYGPAALQVFEEVLERKLTAAKKGTGIHYLEQKVLAPMGLGSQRYLADKAGHPLLAAGFMMTAPQWARLGERLLAGGAPIVGKGSLEQALRGSPANRAFGMGFWNNRQATSGNARESDIEDILEKNWKLQDWIGICLCRDAPADLIAGIGSGYQRLYVVPSLGLVVVRFGNGARFSDAEFLRRLFGR